MRYLVLFLAFLLAGCFRSPEIPPPSIERTPAPEFRLQNLQGDTIEANAFHGQWIVLNIWATWCPPCTREIPDFIRLQEKLADRGVQFIGISVDDGGLAVVQSFAQRNAINYPILMANMEMIRTLFGSIDAIPTTFIIDPDWYLVNKHTGLLTYDALKDELSARISAYKSSH